MVIVRYTRPATSVLYLTRSFLRLSSLVTRPLSSLSSTRPTVKLPHPIFNKYSPRPIVGPSHSHIFSMPLVTIATNIADALQKHGVVPDVLDQITPKGLITVTYGKDTEVALGNLLKPAETQERPKVAIAFADETADPQATYTLVMTDPDAPTRGDKKWSEYCHYVTTGIKPNVDGSNPNEVGTLIDFSKAHDLVEYMGPAPPPSTGKHRYVWILYRNFPGVTPKIYEGDNRANWGTNQPGSGARDWAQKNKLTPVATNFFYAQNPDQSKL